MCKKPLIHPDCQSGQKSPHFDKSGEVGQGEWEKWGKTGDCQRDEKGSGEKWWRFHGRVCLKDEWWVEKWGGRWGTGVGEQLGSGEERKKEQERIVEEEGHRPHFITNG